jgi:hypothetical protein
MKRAASGEDEEPTKLGGAATTERGSESGSNRATAKPGLH